MGQVNIACGIRYDLCWSGMKPCSRFVSLLIKLDTSDLDTPTYSHALVFWYYRTIHCYLFWSVVLFIDTQWKNLGCMCVTESCPIT